MSQQDCLGIRAKWVSKIQEYDLEIKPTKLIKGQGLANMCWKETIRENLGSKMGLIRKRAKDMFF